jgi:predicted nucleotidyltransferase
MTKFSPDSIKQQFTVHPTLKHEFWGNDMILNPKIRKTLLKIAKLFLATLDKPVTIKDITFTGSLANYNYSPLSDIDLHIVIDYDEVGKDRTIVEEYLSLKKNKWNLDHDIKIFGHEVEVYVEDEEVSHITTGLYSLVQNKWIKVPSKDQPPFDANDVATKANYFKNLYVAVLKRYKSGNMDDIAATIKDVKDKIKTMRKAGLQKNGEYSTENLAFKVLRRSGLLDKFTELYNHVIDKKLSV